MCPTIIENCKTNSINKIEKSLVRLGLKSGLAVKLAKSKNEPLKYKVQKKLKYVSAEKAFPSIRNAEIHDRLNDLKSTDATLRLGSVLWFGEQGEKGHIKILKEHKGKEKKDKIKLAIDKSIFNINGRENSNMENLKVLTDFFDLNRDKLNKSIRSTIEKCKKVSHPALRSIFNADNEQDVICALQEVKELLEKHNDSNEIKKWLEIPIANFKNDTPKEALLKGRVLQVLYYLRKIEEQVYG